MLMTSPTLKLPPLEEALYFLNHVFMPPKLPQSDDSNPESDIALCHWIYNASLNFSDQILSPSQQGSWFIVSNMLGRLLQTTRMLDKDLLINNILRLKDGDVLALQIRAQNAALILRRVADSVTFEAFEVSVPPGAVMGVEGKLICSYPGPAVELPLSVARDPSFVEQLASFLVQMDVDRLDAEATTIKAGSKVQETRSTTHPRYISQLLIMILRGMGKEARISRIAKRIADDACWDNARNPWRRSSLWLVLRIAIQTTADSRETYKAFMIFFQAELLQLFLDLNLSSELLFVTRAKTSRRVYKLSAPPAYPRLLLKVESVGKAIEKCLQGRWSEEQHLQRNFPSYIPNISTLANDTTILLLHSKAYLTKIMCPDPYQHNFTTFCPSHSPRLRDTFDFHHPDALMTAVQADPHVALADFELLVQERLDGWVMENSHNESACQMLGSCLEHYISSTKAHYSSPEDQSLMLLTIMQLWVALDTVAVLHCPLLLLYPPDIPISVLHPLLLRGAKSIERAACVELYLRHRYSNAIIETSVFSDKLDQSTFSVKYFQISPPLQNVKASIEKEAADIRERKCMELRTMNAEHASLTEELNKSSCTYFEVNGRQKHSKVCSRCRLESKVNRMRITVHEWPLPIRPLEADAIVFELNCPPVFAIWRTRTYQILRDIGMAKVKVQSKFKPHVVLEDYGGLATWSKTGSSGRITFGSETKSFLSSHYRDRPIPTDEDSICVNNGLRFKLYDCVKGESVSATFDLNLDSYCTLILYGDGEGLYKHLQYAVSHTTHAHNETIVSQGDCPVNLSVHEHLAFSNLRCGSRLQWKNIARELCTNVLTFSREEVHTLITQAAWQIGPLSDNGSVRLWHSELAIPDFGLVLIREATSLLSRVEANWVEGTTVKSIIYLTSRLLASTSDDHAQLRQNGHTLLRKARSVTHKWMREIMLKLQSAVDDDVASELQRRVCEIAATCRATFDVDARTHLNSLLYSSEDIAILVECAIVIHDNTSPHLGHTFLDFQKLLHRDRRLSHRLESRIKTLIRVNRGGLDAALVSVWPGYHAGDGEWKLSEVNSPWLTSLTAQSLGQQTQQVHYNVLEGRLLIDGKPLGRLPRDIVSHSTYSRIFGQKILDVIPSDMPGMDYVTRSIVHGYQVYFALCPSPQGLVIRARKSSGQVFELIPHEILLLDFPTFFSTETVHWMDTHCGEVEFRPLDKLWEQSSQNWRLIFSQDGPCRMIQGTTVNRYLLDIHSETFRNIASQIRPLEYSEYLIAVYDVPLNTISIELPRFRLCFFVNDGELELKNMPGMVIDNDQYTGTMIGLSSQLVLRQKDPRFAGLPRSRFVLIPHGNVNFSISPDQNHVRVHIDTRTKFIRRVTWYKYEIDSDLGLLVGNVNLTSRLYRIYLHSLCSHPLPDPLTRQTGTVHALQELGNAACFSFQKLTEADVKLLRLIGSITPHRNYYPKHLQIMQTVKWSHYLPALSQHNMFDTTVCRILQHAESLTIFDEPKETENHLEYKSDSNSLLMARASRRNVLFYQGGLDSDVPPALDKNYQSRDSPHADHDDEGLTALHTSQLIYSWPAGLTRPLASNTELIKTFESWHHMSGLVQRASLVYNREWLHLDMSERWLSIYDQCRQIGPSIPKKFELIFSFPALAYSEPKNRDFIPVLLAVAAVGRPSFVKPPIHLSYDLTDGFEPLRERVRAVIASATYPLSSSPARLFGREAGETQKQLRFRQAEYYEDNSRRKAESAVNYLMSQQHSDSPQSPFLNNDDSHWFNTDTIMTSVTEYFASCSRNRDLCSFTTQVTTALKANCNVSPLAMETIPRFCCTPQFELSSHCLHSASQFSLAELLSIRVRDVPAHSYPEFGTGAPINHQHLDQSIDTSNLKILISQFKRNSQSQLSQAYSKRLQKSRRQLQSQHTSTSLRLLPAMNLCLAYRDQCQSHLDEIWSSFCSALAPSTVREIVLADAGLWPQIHPRAILNPLASTARTHLAPEWAECLTAYAEAFIEYQHSQRLVLYALRSESDNFFQELDTTSFDRLDARKNPDWLLIQIQGNFVIRAIQSDVAREMIRPSSGKNTVLQLNMGEGKSHVIVPLVAAALADSRKLARVVVLKPLASQMFHLLVERISGLANRRVFYLPFSRDVKMSIKQIQCIQDLFKMCANVRGVLVAQPEHILSFQLMVIDRKISSSSPLDPIAQALQKTQKWLNSASRDILDESDELLHVRYQLIYTMDQQQPLDDSPDRWTTTQQVFELVRRRIMQLHRDFPHEVEVQLRTTQYHEGEFSHVRLLGNPSARVLVSQIAEDALAGALGNLNFVGLGAEPRFRTTLLSFIKKHDIDRQTYDTVKSFYGNSVLWRGLLLLRGLLAEGILVYVLSQRRWRVDYGLDLKRSLLAVPYRAKDVPSLRSEFGHPDVAVCLTCLSFYYGGLTSLQVQECFELLFKLDNPPLEYENWVKRGGDSIPITFHQLIGVNTKDVQTFMSNVVPIFQRNQAVIDFFLSQVVFPRYAKEFPSKLGTSGWDLAQRKPNFTTGFSGTNDNSDLLPTSITQSDPVNQLRTNAQVLSYLLQEENKTYIFAQGQGGQPYSAAEFLEMMARDLPEVRVLLDVGAQMLEMTNEKLVEYWLSLKLDIAAGVFFDDDDNLSVLTRDGIVEPLYSSSFFEQLDQCIVYLDDAHTRGTDLKLPLNFKAVVTLGPNVTKDRLVQGCMRMRKLGHGQSVVFCAPPEVDRRIRESEKISHSCSVKVIDLLSWVMSTTCADIERHIPHWVQQGIDYHRRVDGVVALSAPNSGIEALKRAWLQPAAQSLEEMYGVLKVTESSNLVEHIPAMQERLRILNVTTLRNARVEEEQEREVNHEVEQELQLERPPRVPPAVHCVDEDVRRLVLNGTIRNNSDTFFPLMNPLRFGSHTLKPGNPWSKQLLATRDFMTTTKQKKEKTVLTDYLRPVHWIVSCGLKNRTLGLVVMSPFEVNALLEDIRTSKYVRLHMYAPRTTQVMKPFDDLAFYCIPPLTQNDTTLPSLPLDIRCQLNIWSGQLYFDRYETYLRLCLLLGISSSETTGNRSVEHDRFVPESDRIGEMIDVCLFRESPLPLLKTLFGLRRKGMSYHSTHMGKVLQARLLTLEDFEELGACATRDRFM